MTKKLTFLLTVFVLLLTVTQSQADNKILFNGKSANQWTITKSVTIKDNALVLSGQSAKAVLKNGKYKNFKLTMDLKTTPGGKGAICFHTNNTMTKGYRVAINNDRTDNIWWRMTGSLLNVRNLTKSFIKENEWFKMQILVSGKEISVLINNRPVVDYIEPAAPYRTKNHASELLSEGTFAIVSNAKGAIQFKDISVEPISDSEVGDIQEQQAQAVNEQSDPIIRLHQEDFPVLDYHVHLKGGLTKEMAAKQSMKTGINYAIAPNCGIGFPITCDADVIAYLDTMRTQPFILAMQCEGREWTKTFSQKVRDEFDYIFTDAMTYTDDNGHRTRSWIPAETFIGNDQEKYMDMILNRICSVLTEPVNIYVNPCYLPEPMLQNFDKFWTEARMNTFVAALAKSGKALEINEHYQIPNKAIIMKAKAAGVKFTFGSNNTTPNVSDLSYSLRMKKECGLTAKDMYRPKVKL